MCPLKGEGRESGGWKKNAGYVISSFTIGDNFIWNVLKTRWEGGLNYGLFDHFVYAKKEEKEIFVIIFVFCSDSETANQIALR